MNADSRIVVTGIGLVTPLGNGTAETWRRLRAGESGIRPMTKLDVAGCGCETGAAVPPYTLANLRAPKNQKFMSPGVVHLMQSALEAVASAGLDLSQPPHERLAVHTGAGQVGPEPLEFFRAFGVAQTKEGLADFELLGGHASRLVDPYFPLRTLSNAGTALVAMELGARGPSNNFVQGEVSSAAALQAACRDLREGRADVALASGAEFLLTATSYLNYAEHGLLSKLPAEEALRPFDREADGLVLGEGAVTLVLERHADAQRRGAEALAEIAGIGMAMDSSDAAEPFLSPDAVAASLQAAFGAGTPDFAIANGYGLPAFDCREAAILSQALGGCPITAIKGQTGYLGAATALVEVAAAIAMLRERTVFPIQHHRSSPAGMDCRLVTQAPLPLSAEAPAAAVLTQSWSGLCSTVWIRAL